MQITRTVLVIFAPPLVAFLLPLVVPLGGPGIAWLQLVTLVWALLAAIIALDPRITEKVAQMRAVLSLLREAAPPSGIAGQAHQDVPAEQAQRARHGAVPRSRGSYAHKPDRRHS